MNFVKLNITCHIFLNTGYYSLYRAIDIKDLKILEISDGLVSQHKKENVNPPKQDSRHPSETTTGKKNGKLDSSVRKSHSKSPVRHGNPEKAGSVSAGNTPQKAEKGKQRQSAFQSPLNKRRENRSDGEHLEEEIHHNDSSITRSKSFTSPSRSNRRANTPENNHRKKTVNGNGAQFVVGGDSTDEEVPWNDRSRRQRKSGEFWSEVIQLISLIRPPSPHPKDKKVEKTKEHLSIDPNDPHTYISAPFDHYMEYQVFNNTHSIRIGLH